MSNSLEEILAMLLRSNAELVQATTVNLLQTAKCAAALSGVAKRIAHLERRIRKVDRRTLLN